MRSIPESLKAKMMELAQTRANDADPRLEAIISRHVIPITDYNFWQTAQVADFTASRVSVSVSRPDYRRMPNKIYVAGIDSGTARIYSAIFDGVHAPQTWTLELSIEGAVEISLAFVGRFKPYKRGRTEFYTTEEKPWIFFVDGSGILWAQHWDDAANKAQLGNTVTSCAATMGINSVENEWGYGLLVAWATEAGAVFYAQYFDGTWSDGIAVTAAPANVVEITISRVADWRIVFLVKDNTGATTAMFFRSIAISMSNWERIEVIAAEVTAGMTDVTYHNAPEDEKVEVADVSVANAWVYSTLPPSPVQAYNIDDGAGNYGRYVLIKFLEDVYDFEGQAGTFKIADESTEWIGVGIIRRPGYEGLWNNDWLRIEFQDFNNLSGEATITYTPGTLSSGVTPANSFTISFTPTGLVPVNIPPAVPVSISNIQEVDLDA
jgi:hypothetical protein